MVAARVRRDTRGVERGAATTLPDVLGRYLTVDERGRGLRATWRPAHGFVNLSLWRGDVCVETFHLTGEQMGELISFLATSLATAAPEPPALRVVEPDEREAPTSSPHRAVHQVRIAAAHALDAMAARIRPPRTR